MFDVPSVISTSFWPLTVVNGAPPNVTEFLVRWPMSVLPQLAT